MLRRKQEEVVEDPEVVAAREAAARADRVTGLPTRKDLGPLLERAVEYGAEQGHRTVLLFIDIGGLRDVNDSYGPDVGDELLRQLAARIQGELGGSQQLLRWAGAEMALVAPGVETVETSRALAEGVCDLVAQPFSISGHTISVSVSVGTALSDAGYGTVRDWIDDAHSAMCDAREMGNRAVITRDEATRGRVDIRITETRLQNAYDHDELRLSWREIVRAEDHQMIGVQAEIVWQDTGAGLKLVEPDKFVPLLEKTGLILDLAPKLLHQACATVVAWNEGRAEPWFLQINLGGRVLGQSTCAGMVAQALDATGLNPEALVLEVEPRAFGQDRAVTFQTLKELKYLGVQLALDEFGAGVNTISNLREIVVDQVRIDPIFVGGLGPSPEDEIITRHLVAMARELGLRVQGDHIERPEQTQKLTEMGATLLAGPAFGQPDLVDEFVRRLS